MTVVALDDAGVMFIVGMTLAIDVVCMDHCVGSYFAIFMVVDVVLIFE